MSATPSFTDLDVLEQVRQFLLAVMPAAVDAVQGQDNRVPEPLANDFIVMWSTEQTELATAIETFTYADGVGTLTIQKSMQWRIQLDIHGDNSAANSATIALMWKSGWCAAFLAGTIITPLYCTAPQQVAFENGEAQYETRWIVAIYLQANPVLTMAQDSADTLGPVNVVEVDTIT